MPPFAEAAARLAFGYARNQYGLRTGRPLRRYFGRTARFLALGARQSEVEADMSGLRVLLNTSDRTIARSVFAAGDWDPLLVGTAFRALDAYGIAYRGKTLLEVGANFGVYCLPAVAEYGFAKAIAYEPDPESFRLLRQNVERNGLDGRVTTHNAALSAVPGELLLRLGRHNAGDNRVVTEEAADNARDLVRVPARTFDDEVAAGRIRLDELGLVWLDVQGHERDVLRGASSLLASNVAVVLEYSTEMMSTDARLDLDHLIATSFDSLVDLGWVTLTDRLRLQPSSAVHALSPSGRAIETDLLLLHRPAVGA
jgi:FkbM family methyltransferase